MKILNKIGILGFMVLLSGLLLGGNKQTVYAAGANDLSATDISQMSSIVSQLQEKISELAIKIQQRQVMQIVPAVTLKADLTPEKLFSIQAEVNRISGEVDQIKAKVAQVLEIRRLEQEIRNLQIAQIARIKQQIDQLKSGSASSLAENQPTATQPQTPLLTPVIISTPAAGNRKEIEDQIAKIKQQISDLTAQAEAQKETEGKSVSEKTSSNTGEATISNVSCAEGQSCSVSGNAGSKSETSSSGNNQSKPVAKGFWQTIGDFIKKLFTF